MNAAGFYRKGNEVAESAPSLLSIAVSVMGGAPPTRFDFAISTLVPHRSVEAGHSVSYPLKVDLISGPPTVVALDVSGAPPDASVSFNPSSGGPLFSLSLVVTTAPSTPAGTYSLIVTGRGGDQVQTIPLTLEVFVPAQPPSEMVTAQLQPQTVTVQSSSRPQIDLTSPDYSWFFALIILVAVGAIGLLVYNEAHRAGRRRLQDRIEPKSKPRSKPEENSTDKYEPSRSDIQYEKQGQMEEYREIGADAKGEHYEFTRSELDYEGDEDLEDYEEGRRKRKKED